jgi:hypothetical protein
VLEVQQPVHKADHSPVPSAKAMKEQGYTSTTLYLHLNGVHRGTVTLCYFYILNKEKYKSSFYVMVSSL